MEKLIKLWRYAALISLPLLMSSGAAAQSQELQQLLMNIEKLTQFKAILSDMKTGYQIYQQGYGTISNLSKGNFSLHQSYLTGLLAVSPAVRNNPRIRQIMGQQTDLLSEYQRYRSLFRQSGSFSGGELTYINSVFEQLVRQSNEDIDDLASITTAGKLRMSDDDRLRSIDRIYQSGMEQLQFLRWFNRKAVMLSLQRSKAVSETQTLRRLYGIN